MKNEIIDLAVMLLKESVALCYTHDHSLIRRKMERSSAARIFHYMQDSINRDRRFEFFKSYDLDSEYNRNCNKPKKTYNRPYGSFPDIILHHRENIPQKDNLLIIEFKMDCNYFDNDDETKLRDFTNMNLGQHDYMFMLGVAVVLNDNNIKYKYFQNASPLCEETVETAWQS